MLLSIWNHFDLMNFQWFCFIHSFIHSVNIGTIFGTGNTFSHTHTHTHKQKMNKEINLLQCVCVFFLLYSMTTIMNWMKQSFPLCFFLWIRSKFYMTNDVDVGDDEIMRINNKDANYFHSLDRFCFGQKILYLSLFFSFTHHYLIYHDDYLV